VLVILVEVRRYKKLIINSLLRILILNSAWEVIWRSDLNVSCTMLLIFLYI